MESFADFLKERNKKKQGKAESQSFADYMAAYQKERSEDIVPVKATDDEIGPVKEEEKERTWFQKGAFEDGYQFGDVTKTILGIEDKKKLNTFTAPETDYSLEELKQKRDYLAGRTWNTAEQSADLLKYTKMYNQMALYQYSETLSKTKMDGQNHTVLEEIEILANMKNGKEKDKRKDAVLKKMEELGMDTSFYADFAGDGEFSWSALGKWAKNAAMAGLASVNKGLLDTADVILGAPMKALGWEDNPFSKGAEYFGTVYDTYKHNANIYANELGGGAWNFGSEAIEGTTGALPHALLMFMTGGASTTATTSSITTQSAMQTGNWLTKAGMTVESMMKNPQYWMSFSRTLGSDYKEAKELGISDAAATVGSILKSTVNAGIEIGFDGGSGIQGLDDALKNGGKPFYEWVESTLEEGGEEMLQKFVGEAIDKVGYGSDKEILNPIEYAKEGALGVISGAALGGGQTVVQSGVNAYNEHQQNKLTDVEQAVVDKVYKDLISEAEKEGKITEREKSKIYDAVLQQMEKGYISTETIEGVLGDRSAYDNLVKESEEFDKLYNTPGGQLSKAQQDRLAQLEEKNKKSPYKALLEAEKGKLSQVVQDMVKGSRLAESYAERGRRGEKFQADVSRYDAKQRATVQAAIDSGVLNNTNRSHEFVDLVAKVSADKGVAFDFTNNEKLKESGFALEGVMVNGFISGSGVTVNVQSAKALNAVVGHEITHVLEGTELYDALAQSITEYAKAKGEYQSRYDRLAKLYEGVENANVEAEVVADLVGDYLFTDKAFVQKLSTENRNVFQKIWDEVKYLCKVVTAGSKEAKQLLEVKKAFEEAYRAATKNPTGEGGVRYSISEIVGVSGKNYGVGVYLDSTLLSNLTEDERIDMVKEYVKELGGSVFTAYDSNGNAVDIHIVESSKKFKNKSGNRVSVNKDLTYRLKNEVKQEAIALVDELVQASTYHGKEPATHPHDWVDDNGANDWDLWKTYIQDKQNTVWEASLRIANSANGEKILYDIYPIKMVEGAGTAATTTTTNNIAQTKPTVNTQNSLSENGQADNIAPLPWQIKGQDVAMENFAPIREDVVVGQNAVSEGDLGTMREDIGKPQTEQEDSKVAKILFDQQQTPKQKSAWKWVREHIFSHGAVFEDLGLKTGNREVPAKFDNIRRAESRAQNFIGKGKGNAKALVDVRKAVEKAGKTKAFNYYLYHLHNADRMTLEQRFEGMSNKSVFGDSVDAETSRKAAVNLETLNPEFKQWAQDVYAINQHLRQMMVDEGIISQETADLWQEMYPHYVPISRTGAKGLNINVPLDTKRTGINAPIKKATGGNSDFYNVFDTMGSRIEQTYKAIARNRFGVELMNTLGTAFESEQADIDTVLENMDTHEELLQEGKNGESPTFAVFQNGEKVKFAITEDMYDAMKPSQFTYTNKTIRKINDVRRDILTTYSPTFALTNPIKDAQDILLNSQHPVRTYAAIPEAIKSVIKKDLWYQERMEHGGNQDTYFDSRTKTFKKEDGWFKKVMGFVPSKIQAANEIIEQVPRMAEYIASRKMGRSIDVSMLDAARVTTNFGAAGDFTNMLNRNGFTFLGASVEGFNQQVRNIREAKAEGVKGVMKLAAKYLAAGLPALLLNHALWDDDEEYEELSDYVKQNYYVVAKTEDGQFVRIPKGRAVAVIQDAFRQMENLITGDDEADWAALGQLILTNLAPNNPMDNNLIAPLAQAYSNQTWYGDELVPTRLQDVPAAEQYDETTDSLSRWLGEVTDTSPYKWNYLLDQYTGGIGDMVLPYLTPEADGGGLGAAFRDKFTTDPVLKNQNVSDFYDKMDELTVNANSMYATDEDILKSKYMSAVNSALSKLYQQKRQIQNSDLSDAEKYVRVRAIQQQIVDLAREGLAGCEEVNIQGVYATVGDRQFRWYEPGEGPEAESVWKKLTADQIAKQDAVTSALGIRPSEYWSRKEEYDYAYDYPGKYALAQAVGGYDSYMGYRDALGDIKSDKDEDGNAISGSRKQKVVDYINGLDAEYGEKIILYVSAYPSKESRAAYGAEIVDYLSSREDISYEDMVSILTELGFTVRDDGWVTWD